MRMWKSLLLQWFNSSPSPSPWSHWSPAGAASSRLPTNQPTQPQKAHSGSCKGTERARERSWADGCSDVAASTEELEQLAAAWPPTAGPPGSACSPHGRDCGRDDGLHHLAQLTCHASSWCRASLRHNRCPAHYKTKPNQTRPSLILSHGWVCERDNALVVVVHLAEKLLASFEYEHCSLSSQSRILGCQMSTVLASDFNICSSLARDLHSRIQSSLPRLILGLARS